MSHNMRILWLMILFSTIFRLKAFNARLATLWKAKYKSPAVTSTTSCAVVRSRSHEQLFPVQTETIRGTTCCSASNGPNENDDKNKRNKDDPEENPDSKELIYGNTGGDGRMAVMGGNNSGRTAQQVLEAIPMSQRVNGARYEAAPNVRNQLGTLTKLTRPENFPGIVLFHMTGIYLALQHLSQTDQFWKILLTEPTMWLTLTALILTSSTSMVVNDYYDAKLGRDANKHKPLVDGELPFFVARRYVSYLYAAALICVAFLPGVPTRLAVILGLMLTYSYTKHFKPVTWLKNVVCAALIALAPLTSGSAALHVMATTSTTTDSVNLFSSMWNTLCSLGIAPLWTLTAILFFGVSGREMMMDCNDVEDDRRAGVWTVPVVHGRRYASKMALAANILMVVFALAGPIIGLVQSGITLTLSASSLSFKAMDLTLFAVSMRRLGFAGTASALALYRGWQVVQVDGGEKQVVDRAVDEGLVTVLFFLASVL